MTDSKFTDDNPEQDYFEHYRFTSDKGQSLMRIDKYLMHRIENASRTKIQNAADAQCILVNDKPVKSSYKVKPLDVISVVLPNPPRNTEILPENIPLNIVYEDDDLLVINKPAGMVVHPGYNNYTGTLVNALAWHFKNLPVGRNGEARPGLVHRIDKNTSGLLVIAKNELSMSFLAKQFFDHSISRTYYALVWGDFEEETGTITGNISRSVRDRKVMAVFADEDIGKPAVTHYTVLERFNYVTLLKCNLETGRTHQIRVHMKFSGHPIFNDDAYGGNKILKGTVFSKYKQFVENCFEIIPRQSLHAKSLGFIHPTTHKEMYFDSELPSDFETVLEKWRNFTKFNSPASE